MSDRFTWPAPPSVRAPHVRELLAGHRYAVDVACIGGTRGATESFAVTLDADGPRASVPVQLSTPCSGATRSFDLRPSTSGFVAVSTTLPATAPDAPGAHGFLVIRAAQPGERLSRPDEHRSPPDGPPSDPDGLSPEPTGAPDEVARSTSDVPNGFGSLRRGRTYRVTAACSSPGPGRVVRWQLDVPGFSGSESADGSIAGGTVACTGRPVTVQQVSAFSGEVNLDVHGAGTPSETGEYQAGSAPDVDTQYWVTVTPVG